MVPMEDSRYDTAALRAEIDCEIDFLRIHGVREGASPSSFFPVKPSIFSYFLALEHLVSDTTPLP